MQYITIDSSVKSVLLWNRWIRLFMSVFLLAYGIRYFYKAYEGAGTLYYSLGVMALVGGVLILFYFIRGPYLKVNGTGLKFKLSLRDTEHTILWRNLVGIRFENSIVYFQLFQGEFWGNKACVETRCGYSRYSSSRGRRVRCLLDIKTIPLRQII